MSLLNQLGVDAARYCESRLTFVASAAASTSKAASAASAAAAAASVPKKALERVAELGRRGGCLL